MVDDDRVVHVRVLLPLVSALLPSDSTVRGFRAAKGRTDCVLCLQIVSTAMAVHGRLLDMDRVHRQGSGEGRTTEPVVPLEFILEILCGILPSVVSVHMISFGHVQSLMCACGQILESESRLVCAEGLEDAEHEGLDRHATFRRIGHTYLDTTLMVSGRLRAHTKPRLTLASLLRHYRHVSCSLLNR